MSDLPLIDPKEYFLSHSRMGTTVNVGPFDSVEEARAFNEKHRFGNLIVGMIHPDDAVNEEGKLRQEVWH